MPFSHICILWFDVFANFEDLKKSELDTCLSRNMPFSLSATCALLESMFLRLLFKLKRPNWSFASAEMCIIIVWALFGFDAACNFCKKKKCKKWHLPQPKYAKYGFHQICMLYLPLLLWKNTNDTNIVICISQKHVLPRFLRISALNQKGPRRTEKKRFSTTLLHKNPRGSRYQLDGILYHTMICCTRL